ncbi:MAG: hypothetical protein LM590_04585 [Thermofilum sp.]|jgi:hypothetical protein|nr:hypothetical protein [Thermofilum sp.]
MGEIVLGTMDFVLLVIGTVALILLLIVFAMEYHYWRLKRQLSKMIVKAG